MYKRQTTGFAARITVNPALIADRSLLVAYNTSPPTAQGDATRPQLMLDRLTKSQRAFTNASGPVSYAHLDVYKRQGFTSACLASSPCGA